VVPDEFYDLALFFPWFHAKDIATERHRVPLIERVRELYV
jgi:hypothetical protein